MRFSTFQVSRRGGREKNEDRIGYCYTREAGLFALADGMGGHPEGEVAAQRVLQTLASMFQREAKPALADPLDFLQDAVQIAHQQLVRYAADKRLADNPRTTLVACILQGRHAYWAHCGDSRLYLVRAAQLIARTRDHSYLELQAALGREPPAGESFNRNVLFTCLGSPGKPMVDTQGPFLLQPGDRLLLCSDGLWGTVLDGAITTQLAQWPIAEAVPELVEQALRNGGARCDNVSALAIEWEGADEASTDEAAGVLSLSPLDADGFASTIQADTGTGTGTGTGTADDAEEPAELRSAMDEDEIVRSVREINEAIRQTHLRTQAGRRSATKKTP
jgi:serine/threonine protein phosphatase PrpC